MAKTAPCFAPCGLRKLESLLEKYCQRPPVDSATFTNANRRAVSVHTFYHDPLQMTDHSAYTGTFCFLPNDNFKPWTKSLKLGTFNNSTKH